MTVASLPRILRLRRLPKIVAILSAVSRHRPFAATFEQLVDGKVALENEIATILDLGDGVEARQVERAAFLSGELWPQHEGPIVERFADDVRAQPVSGGLQRSHVINRQEGIVVLAEADLRAVEFLRDEAVAIEVVRRLEGEERGHTHHHRTENLIADIEVIVGEAATLASEDAVMRVLGGIFRQADTEARTLLHALEDDCVKKMREHRAAREMKVGPS